MTEQKKQKTAIQNFRSFILRLLPVVTTGYGLPKEGYPKPYRDKDCADVNPGLPLLGNRFTDFEDGTIYDNVTGLMWVHDPRKCGPPFGSGEDVYVLTWDEAIDACEDLVYAGHSDWRMPNMNELLSLLYVMENGYHFDYTAFPFIYNYYYWASTTYAFDTLAAWAMEYVYGMTYGLLKESEVLTMIVRGGRINA